MNRNLFHWLFIPALVLGFGKIVQGVIMLANAFSKGVKSYDLASAGIYLLGGFLLILLAVFSRQGKMDQVMLSSSCLFAFALLLFVLTSFSATYLIDMGVGAFLFYIAYYSSR